MTIGWAKASESQQSVLKVETDRLEAEIAYWKPRVEPISKRLKVLREADNVRARERRKLIAEWPTLEFREKGEAMRRTFKKVTLYWHREFVPAKSNAAQPRKTTRPGRNKFTLLHDKIEWSFADFNLEGSS
ncbi:hypothetical protein SH661x_000824 [Planctomicrobium sp. SH661]|uniref:hypothetical protein n=1 Tax=Planctomicrobium sp. SH661 TaxID=3448124 RepID=UPI003F5B8EA8